MPASPIDDLALKLWRDGYRALAAERLRHDDPDAFEGSLLGRRTAVVRGAEGARLFYDTSRVRRGRAIPAPLAGLIFGRGAVHGLDDEAHAERKGMFLGLLDEDRIGPLASAIGADLRRRAAGWHGREVVVFDELVETYGAAVLRWAGVELPAREERAWSRRLAAIVDGFGFAGAAYARGWRARLVADRWAARLIEETRRGRRTPPADTALAVIAASDLPSRVAGVELLNVLRPTVAVAWPATFAALALVTHPEWRDSLTGPDAERRRIAFGHEARRLYPFVPALAGRARCPVKAGPVELREGDRIMLDVIGTDHDPQTWRDPEAFVPDRFVDNDPDSYGYVPQGGGDPATGHRCPGEPLTVRLLAETVGALAEVDLRVVSRPAYDPRRMPARPDRGLVVSRGS
ncbi:fatty-acid peroxygenase [Nocardioides terrae]|uniref:Fatty-acid peroxygenase n=1 Tax=Nocardioides terrae TaxID=574651 RepID=A0A1I1IJ20_9ACTN|nr:cytochrome P450 [Nocardioides terrae]SFC33783.1 fatty-acid peroxygenase [Nocardioides terrae]